MAEGTIDSISIEVSSDASAAVRSLNSLIASLGKLETKAGTSVTKLASLSTAVKSLATASSGFDASGLKQLSEVKFSATVAKNIEKLSAALSSMPSEAVSKLSSLGSALKDLSGLVISSSAVNQLAKLPSVLKEFSGLDVSGLTSQMKQLTSSLTPLAAAIDNLATAYAKLPSSMNSTARATRSVTSANRLLSTSSAAVTTATTEQISKTSSLKTALSNIVTTIGKVTAAWYAFKTVFDATVGEVNEFIENMNLFNASMGEYAESAYEYGETVSDALGIDISDWARNQGVFQTLITGMGDTAERANVMSQQLTQLGYDIASFYNISVEDAMLKLQSGMSGELEPLRRLGWDLSQARLQLEATNLGIEENVASMTQAEKVGLRYYAIMNQVTQTHGDMARTIASPANQLRVLQAQVTLAARAIGNLFIPALNAILPVVIGVVKAIRLLAQTIADFFGIDVTFEVDYSTLDTSGISTGGTDDLTDSLDDTADAADSASEAVEKYKNTVMGFDELNKLNEPTESSDSSGSGGSGGSDGSGSSGIDIPLDTYDFLEGLTDTIGELTDAIAEKLMSLLPIITAIGAAFATWKLGSALSKGLTSLSKKLTTASQKALELANSLAKSNNKTVAKLSGYVGNIGVCLGNAAVFAADIAKKIGGWKLAGAAAVAAVIVGRFTDLVLNSETFQDGLSTIYGWLCMIPDVFSDICELASQVWQAIKNWASAISVDIPWVGVIIDALQSIVDFIASLALPAIEALDLDFADVAITVAGLVLVLSGVGTAFGAVLLVFEAITLAIRGIGWATEPCAESVDALGDVSEETAERFGTSLDSMEGAVNELDQLDFSDAVVSEEDVESIGDKCEDIRDTILDNLDANRNEELASIEAMAGFLTDEEVAQAKERVNEAYDEQEEAVTSGTEEINGILLQAKEDGVALTQDQSDRINEILEQQYQQLIETSGASQEEINAINEAMANNNEAAALEAAQTVIQAAQQARDDTKSAAEESYENQLDVANRMLEAGDIDQQRYDEIVAAAEEARDLTVQAAEEQYQGIVDETESGLGDAAEKFDFETGEIKSNWDVFLDDLSEGWDTFSTTFAQTWSDGWNDYKEAFDQFCLDASGAWEDFCSDIKTWYDTNLKPTIDTIKEKFEWLSDKIEGFMSDPVGSIKRAWSDISTWFDLNVAQPVANAFLFIPRKLREAMNWVIDQLNSIKIELPDVVAQITGWSSIGFNIPRIPAFAEGRYGIDAGQLFVARESGPEMVGQMGSHTTVANNQQIVEGIEAGVYNAVAKALASVGSSGGDTTIEIPLRIGNEELARAAWKGQASLVRRGEIKASFA